MVMRNTHEALFPALARIVFFAGLACLILAACSKQNDVPLPYDRESVIAEHPVPFVRLIARPETYTGQQIAVSGYLRLGFEENALYYNKDDYTHDLHMNGLWLDLPTTAERHKLQFDDTYVTVIGLFDAKRYGHGRLFAGELREIVSIDVVAHSDGTIPTNPPYLKIDGPSVTIGWIEGSLGAAMKSSRKALTGDCGETLAP